MHGWKERFPSGSDSYIKTRLSDGLVSETAHVGYNKAALMVQKGNPKDLDSNLDNLKNPRYYVVIGNPDSGGIGKETQKILDKKGIFKDVAQNARKLTTDSKGLAVQVNFLFSLNHDRDRERIHVVINANIGCLFHGLPSFSISTSRYFGIPWISPFHII